jgi:hypothetical protein
MFVRTSRVTLRRTIVVLDPGHGDVQLVVAVRAPRAAIDPERSGGFEDEFSYEMASNAWVLVSRLRV